MSLEQLNNEPLPETTTFVEEDLHSTIVLPQSQENGDSINNRPNPPPSGGAMMVPPPARLETVVDPLKEEKKRQEVERAKQDKLEKRAAQLVIEAEQQAEKIRHDLEEQVRRDVQMAEEKRRAEQHAKQAQEERDRIYQDKLAKEAEIEAKKKTIANQKTVVTQRPIEKETVSITTSTTKGQSQPQPEPQPEQPKSLFQRLAQFLFGTN